jgi:hypothetical protein
VTWEDKKGRQHLRAIPNGVPDSQAEIGIPIGPPPLDKLGLPEEIEIRLHNQLYARQIFTSADARGRVQEIQSALMAALRVDVNRILAIYEGAGAET